MKPQYLILGALGAWMLLLAPAAFAAGTAAGTSVTNQASVDYEVNGIAQPQELSNTDSFLVDRRIDVTVAELGGAYTDVTPGSTDQVLSFSVTNSTNDTVDFRLAAAQSFTDPFGGTDNFDVTNIRFYQDDGDGLFDSNTDTLVTFLDEMTADETRTVFVVADIPAGRDDNDIATVTLTAIASSDGSAGATSDYVETAGADTQGSVDTVFGDGAGDTDAARDGRFSDTGAYRVRTATLTVTKSSTVISDPFNGTTEPKRIPGAIIEYCVDVANTGSTPADTVVISDAIPANTLYVAGSIRTAVTGTGTACTSGTGVSEDDDAIDADETDPDGGDYDVTTPGAVTITTPSIAATSGRFKALFRVEIQ
jgi:uncharacterized repeat protein (TIGR01451 family)